MHQYPVIDETGQPVGVKVTLQGRLIVVLAHPVEEWLPSLSFARIVVEERVQHAGARLPDMAEAQRELRQCLPRGAALIQHEQSGREPRAIGARFAVQQSRGAHLPKDVERILRLHDIFRHMRAPALLHCKSGADRAGLAAGLFVLFQGGTAREALAQLSLRFGHIRQARTGVLDAFFHHYAREAEGRKPFLDWVREDYDQAALQRDFHANGLASFINDWVLVHE